jgi:hypothetical protein
MNIGKTRTYFEMEGVCDKINFMRIGNQWRNQGGRWGAWHPQAQYISINTYINN